MTPPPRARAATTSRGAGSPPAAAAASSGSRSPTARTCGSRGSACGKRLRGGSARSWLAPSHRPRCYYFEGSRLERLQLGAAQSGQKELTVGRDTELAIARPLVAPGTALLEEEGVGRKLELAVSHSIAQQHLPAGERCAVLQAPERRDRALVEQRDNATVRD